jgi:hypothetical protein
MAVDVKGSLSIIETVGSQVTISEEGITSATVEYTCSHEGAVSAANGMAAHPDYSYLLRKNIKVTFEEGGIARISANFEGIAPQGGGQGTGVSLPKYSMKSAVSSEPIQQHKDFDKFIVPEQTGAQFEKVGTLRETFLGFTKLDTPIQRLFYGTKSYLAPSITFQETVTYERASNLSSSVKADLSKIGRVDTPPNVSSFITVPSDCNWLLIGADSEPVGLGFKVTRQWKLSTPGGWNAFIYGQGSTTGSD